MRNNKNTTYTAEIVFILKGLTNLCKIQSNISVLYPCHDTTKSTTNENKIIMQRKYFHCLAAIQHLSFVHLIKGIKFRATHIK